jgi:hypothetical protein
MSLGRVWTGTVLPPLVWAADLGGKLMLSRTVNATERKLPLHLLTIAALVLAGVAFWMSHRSWRQSNQLLARTEGDQRGTIAAARSVARWGMALAVFFGLIIAAMAVPSFVLGPRDLP